MTAAGGAGSRAAADAEAAGYDSGDDWEIGVGDLIIDLDADLEKDRQKLQELAKGEALASGLSMQEQRQRRRRQKKQQQQQEQQQQQQEQESSEGKGPKSKRRKAVKSVRGAMVEASQKDAGQQGRPALRDVGRASPVGGSKAGRPGAKKRSRGKKDKGEPTGGTVALPSSAQQQQTCRDAAQGRAPEVVKSALETTLLGNCTATEGDMAKDAQGPPEEAHATKRPKTDKVSLV